MLRLLFFLPLELKPEYLFGTNKLIKIESFANKEMIHDDLGKSIQKNLSLCLKT